MPSYEYGCEKCGRGFEQLQDIGTVQLRKVSQLQPVELEASYRRGCWFAFAGRLLDEFGDLFEFGMFCAAEQFK